jgi:hypothetical protein
MRSCADGCQSVILLIRQEQRRLLEHLDIMDRWDWHEIFAKAGLLLLLVTGCGKKEDFRSVLLVSHAGMGLNIQNSIYHDNSREALDMACSMIGCDGVEVDVQLSKDGELWLYHDATLESESNGEGCVPELTRDELEDIRYNSVHKEKLCPLPLCKRNAGSSQTTTNGSTL